MNPPDPIPQDLLDRMTDALKIAKITMMMQRNTTFYTTIIFSLKQRITNEIPTAATDGRELIFNPQFFVDLSPNERIALMAHEALHVALDHMHRRGDRDPQWWNIAADYVINGHLRKAGYTLPKGGLDDPKYDGKSSEEVYDILYKKPKDQQTQILSACGPTSQNGNDVSYPENAPKDPVTQEEVTAVILRANTQAKAMGQQPGSIPGEVDVELQRLLNPPLPWNVILQNYMTEFGKDDYTLRKPNRRFMPRHYLPTAHSEALANIAVILDLSCSVSDHEINTFVAKVDDILRLMQPKKVTVVAFDTAIRSECVLTPDDNPYKKLKFKARGGTSITPVHVWINEHKPTVSIILTDGEFTQHAPRDPRCPIVWLIHDDKKWQSKHGGRVIHYDIEK